MSHQRNQNPQLVSIEQYKRLTEQLKRDNKNLRVEAIKKDEKIVALENDLESLLDSGLCGRDSMQTVELSIYDLKVQGETSTWIHNHFWPHHKHLQKNSFRFTPDKPGSLCHHLDKVITWPPECTNKKVYFLLQVKGFAIAKMVELRTNAVRRIRAAVLGTLICLFVFW